MVDDVGVTSFEDELKVRQLAYERRPVGTLTAFVVGGYVIPRGPFANRTIELAVLLPADYPSTAPAGIHTRRGTEISAKVQNPQNSDLGGDWQRWSRVVQFWVPGKRRADLFLGQVDAWLEFR